MLFKDVITSSDLIGTVAFFVVKGVDEHLGRLLKKLEEV
jgi:hypothetical protein